MIRTGTSKLLMKGMNCTLTACSPVNVLSVTLGTGVGDGTFTCENVGSGTGGEDLGCDGNTDATLEFDWLNGCDGATEGCQGATTTDAPGGGRYLFLFLTDFKVKEQFTSYWFEFEHGNSLVNAHDYAVSAACGAATSGKLASFNVYDAVGANSRDYAATTVTLS